MKRSFSLLLLAAVLLGSAPRANAQQIPYLNELFSRYELFNRLFASKRTDSKLAGALEPLRKRSEDEFKRGNIPGILELQSQALTMLQGKQWDERQKFISSLTLETNRLVLEPNTELHAAMPRMFPSDSSKAFSSQPLVTFEIIEGSPAGAQQPGSRSNIQRLSKPLTIADRVGIAETTTNAARRLLLADGAYWVVARVEAGGQQLVELKQPFYAISNFTDSINQLSKLIADIKASTEPAVQAVAPLVSTPEFRLQRLAALTKTRGEYDVDPIEELDKIEAALSQLARGVNPFNTERGILERAYRGSDGNLVPYRLCVPASYDGTSAKPLVVMLHGALGDERYYFGGMIDPNVIQREAERRGWLFAGVNGRGRFARYQGLSLEDSHEVVKAVTRDFKIDSARIFLTGHSSGGFGVWLVASAKPEVFAAVASVSAGVPAPGEQLTTLLERIKSVPVLVIHGSRDNIVTPDNSKAMVAAAQKAGLKVSHLEPADADHFSVLQDSIPAILDFFDKNPKPSPEK
jgi:predicted esterase